MRRRMPAVVVTVVAVAAVVIILVLARASGGDKVTGDTFETTVEKTFTIALDANATTGYNWSQTINDTDVVAYVDNAYIAEARDPQVVGGGGTDTFTFKAVGKGTTTITLAYARPWESVPPAETRTITVTVKYHNDETRTAPNLATAGRGNLPSTSWYTRSRTPLAGEARQPVTVFAPRLVRAGPARIASHVELQHVRSFRTELDCARRRMLSKRSYP